MVLKTYTINTNIVIYVLLFLLIGILQIQIYFTLTSITNKLIKIKANQKTVEKSILEQNTLLKRAIKQGIVVVYEDKEGNFIPIHKRIKN